MEKFGLFLFLPQFLKKISGLFSLIWITWKEFPSFDRVFGGIFQGLDPAAHTIKSHGAKVAKNHLHDWLILLLLAAIVVILVSIHPFYRFVGKDMMTDLKYPLKDNTVPVWSVPVSSCSCSSSNRIRRFSSFWFKCSSVCYCLLLLFVSCMLLYCLFWYSWSSTYGGGTFMICTMPF